MPEFIYSARDGEGKLVSEIIDAPSREAVGQALRSRGLIPTSIAEHKVGSSWKHAVSLAFSHVSLLEKLTFIKNLGVTIKAGLPVSKALQTLVKQMPNPYFRNAISEIAHNVESGKTLSESLGEFPNIFSPIFVNMVKVGEQSGELDKSLEYLGTQLGRDYNLLRRTKGALTYPAVVVSALLVIGYIMFSYVLPKLTVTFKEFGADLPLLTKVIIGIVDVFSKYSLILLAVVVVLLTALWFWRKTQSGKRFLHQLNLKIPVIGKIVKKLNMARFTIIFSGLLRSGMPIVEAMRITSDTMNNIYYRSALADASEKIKIGVDLVVALEKYPQLFAPMVTQMIQVGEETGTMEKVLTEVSNFYEAEIDDTVKNLSSIIEPVLVILIGAVVGVLAVGLILPIYSIGQNI